MDNWLFEQASPSHSRKARIGWWLGLALVVILAVVIHYAYHPAQSVAIAAVIPADTRGAAAVSAPATIFPRELVELEAAGAITLARRSTLPRELVEMEAAGWVTLTRPTSNQRTYP